MARIKASFVFSISIALVATILIIGGVCAGLTVFLVRKNRSRRLKLPTA